MVRRRNLLLFFFSSLCFLSQPRAESSSSTFKAEIAFPSFQFELPVFIATPPGNSKRLFVVEQGGRIISFADSKDATRCQTVLDITAQVKNEHVFEGLLAMAFHPKYSKNHLIYVSYIADKPRRLVVSEFRVNSITHAAKSKSERIILAIEEPSGTNNGGMIAFGPDGFLFISVGDYLEFQTVNDQRPKIQNLSGSILRLDVDHPAPGKPYSVPADNPFLAETGQRSEVWAFGLRNICRFSFDEKTGDFWATDNGPKNWEEINLIKKGGNYGWNLREGKHPAESDIGTGPNPNLIDPVFEYSHAEGEFIIGGGVYRKKMYPELEGLYLFGDMMRGNIWALKSTEINPSNPAPLADVPTISSLIIGREGQIYVTSYYGGKIYSLKKIQP